MSRLKVLTNISDSDFGYSFYTYQTTYYSTVIQPFKPKKKAKKKGGHPLTNIFKDV